MVSATSAAEWGSMKEVVEDRHHGLYLWTGSMSEQMGREISSSRTEVALSQHGAVFSVRFADHFTTEGPNECSLKGTKTPTVPYKPS